MPVSNEFAARAQIPSNKEGRRALSKIHFVLTRKQQIARRRGLIVTASILLLLIAGLAGWQWLAHRAKRPSPVDQLLLEVLSPAITVAGKARNRIYPDVRYQTDPQTAVGAARLAQLAEENRALRATLQLRDSLPQGGLAAEIVGRNNVPWQGNLLIDKGDADGVAAQMVVLTPDGVLGQIGSVTPHTATILPLTATERESGIPAMTARTKSPGILKGGAGGACQLVYLSGELDVQPGDDVVTSGLGEIFPKGLPLGRVTKVTADPSLTSRTAAVQPAADPARAEMVVLVKR